MKIGNAKFVGEVSFGGKVYSPDEISSLLEGGGGMTIVENNSNSNAYIPVLSGGMCYKYTKPLKSLEVASIVDTPKEDVIIFSAGETLMPLSEFTVFFNSAYIQETEGPPEARIGSYGFTLSANPTGGFIRTTREHEEISYQNQDWTYYNGLEEFWATAHVYLSDFVLSATIDENLIVISGAFTVSGNIENFETADLHNVFSVTTSGIVASSSDGGGTWNYGGLTIPSFMMVDNYAFDGNVFNGSACKIDYTYPVEPCNIKLPYGTVLMNNSTIDIETNHSYEMNIANRGVVIAERVDFNPDYGYFTVFRDGEEDSIDDTFYWNEERQGFVSQNDNDSWIEYNTQNGDYIWHQVNGGTYEGNVSDHDGYYQIVYHSLEER